MSGNYDLDSISEIELRQTEVSLKEAFRNVEDLHYARVKKTFAAKVKEAEQNDFVAVKNKYYEALESETVIDRICFRSS